MPSLGAIAGTLGGGRGALLGAIAGCHCSVLWLGASVTTTFGGVDVVPWERGHGTLHSNGSIQKKHPEKLP